MLKLILYHVFLNSLLLFNWPNHVVCPILQIMCSRLILLCSCLELQVYNADFVFFNDGWFCDSIVVFSQTLSFSAKRRLIPRTVVKIKGRPSLKANACADDPNVIITIAEPSTVENKNSHIF